MCIIQFCLHCRGNKHFQRQFSLLGGFGDPPRGCHPQSEARKSRCPFAPGRDSLFATLWQPAVVCRSAVPIPAWYQAFHPKEDHAKSKGIKGRCTANGLNGWKSKRHTNEGWGRKPLFGPMWRIGGQHPEESCLQSPQEIYYCYGRFAQKWLPETPEQLREGLQGGMQGASILFIGAGVRFQP